MLLLGIGKLLIIILVKIAALFNKKRKSKPVAIMFNFSDQEQIKYFSGLLLGFIGEHELPTGNNSVH